MPLTSGARIGSYTIAGKLGAGGMGEVYRATDTRLHRQVAIKVLPPEVAQDPDRLSRFQREAQVLASLNHSGIAAIYGLDEAEGKPFLVMELVEGEELRERLERGPIPMDETLDLARQMADALEAAHEKGIVHRDLKPANLKITEDGKLKILDFGLARAFGRDGPGKSGPDLANSPTMTEAGTVAGMILGTAAYMSPEQARGKTVDKRADIWAFGVVLHEMLTGKQLFAGETVSDTLAAVLTREPDLQALPPVVPQRVRALLARCLRKDPRERLRDIGDARLELAEPAMAEAAPQTPAAPRRMPAWMPILAAAAVLAALAGGVLYGRRSAPATELPLYRLLTFGRGYVYSARFAPDGQTIVYGAAFEEHPVQLYTTRADGHDSRPIDLPSADVVGIAKDGRMALILGRHYAGSWSSRAGTLAQVSLSGGAPREILEQVMAADISPDGERFAVAIDDRGQRVLQYPIGKELFRTDGWIGELRISPDGRSVAFVHHRLYGDDLGEPAVVREGEKMTALGPEAQYAHGLCWSPDGRDVWFSMGEVVRGGEVWSVPASGGTPRLVLRSPATVRVLDVAADGRLLLASDETRASVAGMLAGDSSERPYTWWDQDVVEGISDDGTVYAGDNPSTQVNGEYAVFARRGSEPPVQVAMGTAAGLTPDGKLVAVTDVSKEQTRIVLQPVGAGQPKEIALGAVRLERWVSFSRDGRRMAFAGRSPGGDARAYVLDLAGGPPRPVGPANAGVVRISPDGSKVAVTMVGGGAYVVSAEGGDPQPISGLPQEQVIGAWSSDGTAVLSWDLTLPPRVFRTPIAGGAPQLVREIALPDPAGVIYGRLVLSPDARYHLLRYRRVLSSVTVVTWK
ncbi:MAG TPA: protein kinase [Candidatus Polarisedimenticolaceae bacterium]|nr:protein kinase [Candidatus Polarisedimenticolaceae bacterium]